MNPIRHYNDQALKMADELAKLTKNTTHREGCRYYDTLCRCGADEINSVASLYLKLREVAEVLGNKQKVPDSVDSFCEICKKPYEKCERNVMLF
jgi:hypothetical protein